MALPSGINILSLNGLPWTHKKEIFLMFILFPLLILIDWGFLANKKVILLLLGIASLKIILMIFSPTAGLNLKIYESADSFSKGEGKDKWEKNYGTFWNRDVSEVFESSFKSKWEFPVEWIHRYNDQKDRDDLRPIITLDGYLRLNQQVNKIAVIAEGAAVDSVITLVTSSPTPIPIQIQVPIFSNEADVKKAKLTSIIDSAASAASAVYKINAKLTYDFMKSKNCSLIFLAMDEHGGIFDFVRAPVMFRDFQSAQVSTKALKSYSYLAKIITILFGYIFLGLWIAHIIYGLYREQILIISAICVGGSILLQNQLVFIFQDPMIAGLATLPFQFMILYCLLILKETNAETNAETNTENKGDLYLFRELLQKRLSNVSNVDNLFLIKVFILWMGLPIIAFYAAKYVGIMEGMSLYKLGGDPLTYQRYARMIALENQWLTGAESIYVYQPLYRYIVAFLHILFGQTSYPQWMLDVWSAVIGSTCLMSIYYRFRANVKNSVFEAFLIGIFCLDSFTIGVYRKHIGYGLQEYTAMMLQMLMMLVIVSAREDGPKDGYKKIILAMILAMLAFWGRMDHLFVLCSAALLLSTVKKIILIWVALGIAMLTVYLHNFIFAGLWVLDNPSNIAYLSCGKFCIQFQNVFNVVTAHIEGLRLEYFPVIFLFLGSVVGIVLGVLRVLRIVKLSFEPFDWRISLLLLSALVPFLFVRTEGYPMRFSIHIMPLACWSFGAILFFLLDLNKNNNKNKDKDN
ncbi:MAG: hypothetical protein HQK49_03880 [Oligoflexia bacterium]|nr:hypothetical protein [Oligoflexia bacterium]